MFVQFASCLVRDETRIREVCLRVQKDFSARFKFYKERAETPLEIQIRIEEATFSYFALALASSQLKI